MEVIFLFYRKLSNDRKVQFTKRIVCNINADLLTFINPKVHIRSQNYIFSNEHLSHWYGYFKCTSFTRCPVLTMLSSVTSDYFMFSVVTLQWKSNLFKHEQHKGNGQGMWFEYSSQAFVDKDTAKNTSQAATMLRHTTNSNFGPYFMMKLIIDTWQFKYLRVKLCWAKIPKL